MITRLYIDKFKGFTDFSAEFNGDLNILVGDNETGKSTILEAIGLALTRRLNGRQIDTDLTPYLLNRAAVAEYVQAIATGKRVLPPRILIELFFQDVDDVAILRGSNNHEKADAPGLRLEIGFNNEYAEEYQAFLKSGPVTTVPIEYYSVQWCSFAGGAITPRSLPIGLSFIDASTIRLQSGADYYLQNIINNGLSAKERVALAMAYRGLKEKFADEPAIAAINRDLQERQGAISDKRLAISMDVSQRSGWEANLSPHLDDLPFGNAGKGEQSRLKIMLALDRHANDAHVVLIEEPENHLSFSSMQELIGKVQERCEGKQIILTTHSAYVLNKLGMDKTILLADGTTKRLSHLPSETQKYFKKLPGYDTLRVMLAKRSILVEGPSDELIVQKAYLKRHGRAASLDGVDIMSVRGLSFARFLDIARELKREMAVITDNDGDHQRNVADRYAGYMDHANIRICADPDNAAPTLEYHLLASNGRAALNTIFGTAYGRDEELLKWMLANKTEGALRILETAEPVSFPPYIEQAL